MAFSSDVGKLQIEALQMPGLEKTNVLGAKLGQDFYNNLSPGNIGKVLLYISGFNSSKTNKKKKKMYTSSYRQVV